MNKILQLNLTSKELIVFENKLSLNKLHCCDHINIYFKNNNDLFIGIISSHDLNDFRDMLIKSLNNQLQLHPSIQQDIGYLANEEYDGNSTLKFIYYDLEDKPYWVGIQYTLWQISGSIRPNLTTWLYNNEKGEIILEITPDYPWHFMDPEPEEVFVAYEQWIKDYKPLLICTIAHEVAKRWLAQVEHLIEAFEKKEKNHIHN